MHNQNQDLSHLERKIDHLTHEVEDLKSQGDKLMSKITDWATQQQADLAQVSTTLDGIVAGISALDKIITDWQNSPGTMDPVDQAALDSAQVAIKALVAKSSAIVVTPPAPV